MREFVLELSLPGCGMRDFFEQIILAASFSAEHHAAQGSSDIDVSEWMEVSPSSSQRLLFFTKKSADGASTRCIEKQSYEYEEGGELMVLESAVTPENPLGNVFRIEARTSVWPRGAGGVHVETRVEIECKKALLGGWGNSTVERVLEGEARADYEAWLARIKQVIRLPEPEAPSASESSSSSSSPDVRIMVRLDGKLGHNTSSSGFFNRHQLRYRISTVGHSVVNAARDPVALLLSDDDYAPRRSRDPVSLLSADGPASAFSAVCPETLGGDRSGSHRRTAAKALMLISLLVALVYSAVHLVAVI